jgi:hypothetical protein
VGGRHSAWYLEGMAQIGVIASLSARVGLLVLVAGSPRAETDTYIAEMKPAGSYAAGQEGTVDVTLTPKGGYHISAGLPYKFKAGDPPDGVTYPKTVLSIADFDTSEGKGHFKFPFVAAHAGRVTVGGTFSFSLCSESNCVMDSVGLEVPVDVK